jgi:hypothetical protein
MFSEHKINPVSKKIQNYRYMFGEQASALNYEISTMWETKPRKTPHKTYQLLMGPEQVTRPKTLQAM